MAKQVQGILLLEEDVSCADCTKVGPPTDRVDQPCSDTLYNTLSCCNNNNLKVVR
jgi:hypothetical protein